MTLEPQIIVLATLLVSVVLFVTDAMRYDLIAIGVVLVLAITGVLTPDQAFSGFSSEAIVVIASMYVFGRATARWGIAEYIAEKLLLSGRQSEAGTIMRVFTVAGLMSSILSNTGVVATLIPVLGSVAKQCKLPISRLLMPLAFGSLLGGMVTVIGTSTNVAVNGAIRDAGGLPFSLFEFTIFGLLMLGLGALFFIGPGRALLPRKRLDQTLSEHYQVPKFMTEVLVEPSSALINRVVADAKFFDAYGVSVLGIVRAEEEGGGTVLAPGPYNRIRTDDVLMVQGDPDAILRLRQDLGLRERATANVGNNPLHSSDVLLVETVVPATSNLIGSTLKDADFHNQTGLNVLAISKHGDVQPRMIGDAQLHVGDTLLIQGHRRDIDRLRASRELLVLDELEHQKFGRGALITVALLIGVLLLTALTDMGLSIAALTGAVGLVVTRCLRPEEVRRSIDWSVLILIGGMLALGKAFEIHHLGTEVADWITGMGSGAGNEYLILSLLLIVTTLLTQVMNHVTAGVIMTPVAMSLAQGLEANDRPFLMAVLVGANLAFMSPVAHQANAMVMGPGDYRYRDFLRVGTPLTVYLGVAAVFFIPMFWPF